MNEPSHQSNAGGPRGSRLDRIDAVRRGLDLLAAATTADAYMEAERHG